MGDLSSLSGSDDILEVEARGDTILIRVRIASIREGGLSELREALDLIADTSTGRLILDLTAVEFLTSACLGYLIKLRRRLMESGRGFQAPCRRRSLFAFYRDADEALAAIRDGEGDPLVFCGVRKEIQQIFIVC